MSRRNASLTIALSLALLSAPLHADRTSSSAFKSADAELINAEINAELVEILAATSTLDIAELIEVQFAIDVMLAHLQAAIRDMGKVSSTRVGSLRE